MWQCEKRGRTFKNTDQHHFCGKIETIDQYISDQAEIVQPLLRKIREVIREAAPDAKEKISWRMPTFWQGENLIHFAAFKKHIGIYPGGEATIAVWCMDYAEAHILPIFEKRCPGDDRPRRAIAASRDWFEGKKKLPEVKNIILNECHAAARELNDDPAAQAAARACGQASACFHTPTHSLGLAFYGAAAIAYDRIGLNEKPEIYDKIAAEECAKMEAALRAIAAKNEPNPAKINWGC